MNGLAMHFSGDEDRILQQRFAEYVRPYPEKVLARTLGCDTRTAKAFRSGESWPNARHWKLIVQAFGRDVLACVFEPEINDTLARLRREERQLEERLDEIRKRRRSAAGGVDSLPERRDAVLDRASIDGEHADLFEGRL